MNVEGSQEIVRESSEVSHSQKAARQSGVITEFACILPETLAGGFVGTHSLVTAKFGCPTGKQDTHCEESAAMSE